MSHSGPSAVNPIVMESPYIPSSESAHSGHSPSPEHPGERVGDSSVRQVPNSLAMQYVNHSNAPIVSTSGYAYAEHNRLHGVTDVDVDEKPHMVYESMTEVQHMARQRMMNGGNNYRTSTHVEAGSGPASDQTEKTKRNDICTGTTCCLINIIWNVFLLFLVAGAFGLAAYNFLQSNAIANTGTLTTDAPTTNTVTSLNDPALVQLQTLNNTVMELRSQLNQIYAAHEDRYNALNASIVSAIQSVRNVNASNEVDLYMGCQDTEAECILDPDDVGAPPSSVSCETGMRPLAEDGFTNADIYCSIDNSFGETNPIVASLNIFGGQMKCRCSLVALSNPTAQVVCKLHVKRCPNTIQLNTSNTQ